MAVKRLHANRVVMSREGKLGAVGHVEGRKGGRVAWTGVHCHALCKHRLLAAVAVHKMPRTTQQAP